MQRIILFLVVLALSAGVNGCMNNENVGTVCMGDNLDTLFEGLPWETRKLVGKGDIIATKNPGLWLDFNYPVVFNEYNTAFGKFAGLDRTFLTTDGQILTREEFAEKLNLKNNAGEKNAPDN